MLLCVISALDAFCQLLRIPVDYHGRYVWDPCDFGFEVTRRRNYFRNFDDIEEIGIPTPPPPRLSRSFRPTRSLATSSLFLASALPLFHLVSPKPEPSRSFRPTRFLAASFLVLPLALPPLSPFSYFFSTARTQWVFPAHSAFSNLLSLPCFRLPPSFT